jgi:cytidylate kinase
MAVITVSREYGSRGEEIAQELAQELGYGYFDKEILADVARIANATEEQISQYDERDEHGLRRFLRKLFSPPGHSRFIDLSFDYFYLPGETGASIEGAATWDASEVIALFREVIEKLWKRGRVVIVGRGSQKILAAKADTLHVRFIGGIGDRAKYVGHRENMTFSEALEKIEKVDEQRANYLKRYYDADWGNPKLYHLIVNTSMMSNEQAVKVIAGAARQLEDNG